MSKQTVLDLLCAAGVFTPFRLANRSKVLILTYHRFSRVEEAGKTSVRAFTAHLNYLTRRYQMLPLAQIAASFATGRRLPPYTAALTIDDGHHDAYDIAFPLLRQYGVPATLFLATDFVDRRGWLWTDKLPYLTAQTAQQEVTATIAGHKLYFPLTEELTRRVAASQLNALLKTLPNEVKEEALVQLADLLAVRLPALPPPEFAAVTWTQAREMAGAGVEIGSHTVTHPLLTRVSDEQLKAELVHSRERLEVMLERAVTLFCYPGGAHDARAQQAVARAGYRCAVTNTNRHELNTAQTPLMALQRVAPQPDLAHFVQSTSGFEHWKLQRRGVASTEVDY